LGLVKDLFDIMGDVLNKVMGWTAKLLYGGLRLFADIFVSHEKAKKFARKVTPWIMSALTALGIYWMWTKIVHFWRVAVAAPLGWKALKATAVGGKRGAIAGMSGLTVLAAVEKVFPWIYWIWGGVTIVGSYFESERAIAE